MNIRNGLFFAGASRTIYIFRLSILKITYWIFQHKSPLSSNNARSYVDALCMALRNIALLWVRAYARQNPLFLRKNSNKWTHICLLMPFFFAIILFSFITRSFVKYSYIFFVYLLNTFQQAQKLAKLGQGCQPKLWKWSDTNMFNNLNVKYISP